MTARSDAGSSEGIFFIVQARTQNRSGIRCAPRKGGGISLRREWPFQELIPAPQKPQKLPAVLSPEEVLHFLDSVGSMKHRTILTTWYAAGLRISEAVDLKPNDVDSQRMVIHVEQGKGQKDRYVMLSPRLLEILRNYWRAVRPKQSLIEGYVAGQPITRDAVHRVCKQAPQVSGIAKPISPHLTLSAEEFIRRSCSTFYPMGSGGFGITVFSETALGRRSSTAAGACSAWQRLNRPPH